MKKLFEFADFGAKLVFVACSALYLLWDDEIIVAEPWVIIFLFQLLLVVGPVIMMTTVVRWIMKWPTTVSWFTIASGLVAAAGFIFAGWSLLSLYAGDTPMIFLKVILPALVPSLSALAMVAAVKWYRDRNHQQPASPPSPPPRNDCTDGRSYDDTKEKLMKKITPFWMVVGAMLAAQLILLAIAGFTTVDKGTGWMLLYCVEIIGAAEIFLGIFLAMTRGIPWLLGSLAFIAFGLIGIIAGRAVQEVVTNQDFPVFMNFLAKYALHMTLVFGFLALGQAVVHFVLPWLYAILKSFRELRAPLA